MTGHILLIEDNAMNMELAEAILEAAGHQVTSATTAEEGIELAKHGGFDLILMDIMLPGIDGLEATRLLKQDPATAGTPVLALTAHALEEERTEALSAGCDGYLTKPIDRSQMLETIDRQLNAA